MPLSEGGEEDEEVEEEVDGQELEHTAKEFESLQAIREYAGTIMTDWQVATALTHLAEMAGDSKRADSEELKMFYLRTRDLIIRALPLELQSRIEERERDERLNNAVSLKRQREAHEERVRDIAGSEDETVEVEMGGE